MSRQAERLGQVAAAVGQHLDCLSPPDALLQASMTNASLTPDTAMVLTPFALIAAAFFTKPGRCLGRSA